jgi:hypothetical protein
VTCSGQSLRHHDALAVGRGPVDVSSMSGTDVSSVLAMLD